MYITYITYIYIYTHVQTYIYIYIYMYTYVYIYKVRFSAFSTTASHVQGIGRARQEGADAHYIIRGSCDILLLLLLLLCLLLLLLILFYSILFCYSLVKSVLV